MSRASSDFSPSRQQATLTTLFKKRQEAFFASLQRFLEAVASDEYIQQMKVNEAIKIVPFLILS